MVVVIEEDQIEDVEEPNRVGIVVRKTESAEDIYPLSLPHSRPHVESLVTLAPWTYTAVARTYDSMRIKETTVGAEKLS